MDRLSARLLTLLTLGVLCLGVVGSVTSLLLTIDVQSALGVVVAGGAVWVTVVVGLRWAGSTQTTYW
jgi:hypothetical protein